MTIGQRISELRKNNSYSQEYVAERLGVSRQAVSKWETDLSAPDTYNLIALAELFGVSVEYIATGKLPKIEEQPTPQIVYQNKMSTQRIIGLILLGAGLISLILGILLSLLLVLVSVFLIVGGAMCIAFKKKVWLALVWTYIAMTFVILSTLTGVNLLNVFFSAVYQGNVTVSLFIALAFWICVAVATVFTVIAAKKRLKRETK